MQLIFEQEHGSIRYIAVLFLPLILLVFGLTIAYMKMISMPERSFRGPLPELSPEQSLIAKQLRGDIHHLAGVIGERHIRREDSLERAAEFITTRFTELGLEPEPEYFVVEGREVKNIVVNLPGESLASEIVVIGAHYDSVPNCPAANDNASGVAALLSVAKQLQRQRLPRTVRIVAFVNEEPPYFQTSEMGSFVHAKNSRERGDNIIAMLSFETIGYYSDERNSQSFPVPLMLFYPTRGNFIAFVGDTGSASLVRRSITAFRKTTSFPSEGAALPAGMPGVSWSDHWAFGQFGYKAVMVTDTAPFRYPYYHTPDDRPERLDYERMARVVSGLGETTAILAGSPQQNK